MRVKKLQDIGIFIVGVIAVFVLIFTRNFFRTNIAHGDTGQNFVIFDGQLSPQFSNWSWGSQVNLNNATPEYSGADTISFTPSPWGGLYLHANSPVTSGNYSSLQFAIQSSDPVRNFTLLFYNNNNQKTNSYPLSQYQGVNQNGWTVYTIPVLDIPPVFGGFALQETSGNAGVATYLSAIQFTGIQPAPTAPVNTVSATGQSYPIYSDSLAAGWINWSWNSTVNFSVTSPVYQGSDAISFTSTSAYGGMYLHTNSGIDTTPYQYVTFAAKANGNGQMYSVGAYDTNNQLMHSALSLNAYGGQPVQNSWKKYTIPLQDLNAQNKTISGIMIQDISGKTQQMLYIDQIALIGSGSTTQATTDGIDLAIVPASQNSQSNQILPGNPLSGLPFYNDPDSDPALMQEEQWQSSDPADAALIAKIANEPKAIWMGDWSGDIQSAVQSEMTKAQLANNLPVFVAYNIPERDCGGYSSGGATSAQAYQTWIDGFAAGIGNGRAAVILEPDAIAQITCLSSADQQTRYNLISYAVQKFKSLGQTAVYIDAGNSSWIDAPDMASRLEQADIQQANGFSLNVSNFMSDSDSITYGQQISGLVGGKHFVIDTSRNGNGPAPDNAWCNPEGRALGDKPTAQTSNPLVDAYLWIKYPGESDGTCNGGPAAGIWYPSYALGLAQQAQW